METARPPSLPTLTAQFRFDLELVILAAALLALVIVGSMVIVRVKRWRTAIDDSTHTFEHYRALFDQGALAPEEFERICKQLQGNASATPTPTVDPGERDDMT